jgi:DNA repair protein RecO (recombination protein O)
MAQYTTEGIVLGVRNWGDADKMVTIFSRERGRLKAAAFGCRRPRSPLAGGMQMFHVLELQLAEGQRLDTVKQCTLRQSFKPLREDLTAMAYGSFIAELALELAPEHMPQPEMFDRLLDILAAFGSRSPRLIALAAGYQLLGFSGSQLQFAHCAHCGKAVADDGYFSVADGGLLCRACADPALPLLPAGVRAFILRLESLEWKQPPAFSVKKTELLQAEYILLDYLQQLLGKSLRSLVFINQLASV